MPDARPVRPSFFMIARKPRGPGSVTAPTKRYSTRADAIADARRLADQTGAEFILLEATETIRPGAPQATLL